LAIAPPFRVSVGIAFQSSSLVEPSRFRHQRPNLRFVGLNELRAEIWMPVDGCLILNKESLDFNLVALKAKNVKVL
jgi:hypothetical protein